jgi:hypothetical protein
MEGAGKVANVCNMSQTVAIEVYLKFEHALFEKNSYSFSACNSKINKWLLWPMWFKQPTYLRTKSSEREMWRSPNKKKICEFMIQATHLVRIAIDTENFDAS